MKHTAVIPSLRGISRLLARRISVVQAVSDRGGVLAQIEDGRHYDAPAMDAIEDSMFKPPHEQPPKFASVVRS